MSACVLKSSTVWADVEPEEPDDGAESVATSSGSEADSDGVEEGEEEEEAEDLSQLHSPLSSPVRSPIAGARREARGRRATSVQSCSSAGSADAVGAAVAPAGRLSDREHHEHAAADERFALAARRGEKGADEGEEHGGAGHGQRATARTRESTPFLEVETDEEDALNTSTSSCGSPSRATRPAADEGGEACSRSVKAHARARLCSVLEPGAVATGSVAPASPSAQSLRVSEPSARAGAPADDEAAAGAGAGLDDGDDQDDDAKNVCVCVWRSCVPRGALFLPSCPVTLQSLPRVHARADSAFTN